MKFASLAALLSVLSAAVAQDTSVTDVVTAFTTYNLTSRLSLNFHPTAILGVTFTAGGQSLSFKAAGPVPRNMTASQPTFSLIGSTEPGPFVIIMTDPDVPTPANPSISQVRHYMGANWYPGTTGSVLQNRSAPITAYFQPAPGVGSPAHRYAYLLYKQPTSFNQQKVVTSQTSVAFFNVSQFATQTGLGDPIAGTFMLTTQN